MAFDGITAYALNEELRAQLIGGRIEKVGQPERDEIVLTVHTQAGKKRLVCCCNSNYPRVHLTEAAKENPLAAPMFCMLLRKHLQSGRITDIPDMGLERMVVLEIETMGELGDREKKYLITEIMGRHSNLILTGPDKTIIDSQKRVDFTVSTVRQVLPGHRYELPPGQGKRDPLTITEAEIHQLIQNPDNTGRVDQFLLSQFEGLSPLTCREITYRAFGDAAIHFEELEQTDSEPSAKSNAIDPLNAGETQFPSASASEPADSGSLVRGGELAFEPREKLVRTIAAYFETVRRKAFSPVVLFDEGTEKPFDFSPLPVRQYEGVKREEAVGSVSAALDVYYTQKDRVERLTQKKASLRKLMMNLLDRVSKKIILQQQSLKDAARKEEFKLKGDLLYANLYRIENGSRSFTAENFYSGNEPVSIQLDENKSPADNAKRYFDKYTKAKHTEEAASKQLRKSLAEMDYLESVYEALKLAQTDGEIAELKDELAENGYLVRSTGGKPPKKQALSKPLAFRSSDGFLISVGKNNRQNDQLTLKTAKNSDLWFHAKNIPGSHTVLSLEGEKNVPEQTILEAARICAYHSKAQQSSNVPVDYTQIRNVRKPGGAKPGMVIYENYQTVYVTPNEAEVSRLKG